MFVLFGVAVGEQAFPGIVQKPAEVYRCELEEDDKHRNYQEQENEWREGIKGFRRRRKRGA